MVFIVKLQTPIDHDGDYGPDNPLLGALSVLLACDGFCAIDGRWWRPKDRIVVLPL